MATPGHASVVYRQPMSGNTINRTITANNTRAINDLKNISTSCRMRVHQAATVGSRFDGSTSATSSSPSATTTTSGTTRRTTAGVYQPRQGASTTSRNYVVYAAVSLR